MRDHDDGRSEQVAHVLLDVLAAPNYETLGEESNAGAIAVALGRMNDIDARTADVSVEGNNITVNIDMSPVVTGAVELAYLLLQRVMELTGETEHDVVAWARGALDGEH